MRTSLSREDRRTVGLHPGWCGGDDHLRTCEDLGADPTGAEHFVMVADDASGWYVEISQAAIVRIGHGAPVITMFAPSDEDSFVQVKMSSTRARSIAAWLLAAADKVEMEP